MAEGGLTDGEPMIFLFGNPTRNTAEATRLFFATVIEKNGYIIADSA